MDCSPPGSSVHGTSQARILEWVAISFSRESSQHRNWTQIAHGWFSGRILTCHEGGPGSFPGPCSRGDPFLGFPCGSAGKESACNAGDLGLIPGVGRSPGEGKGYPLQYSGPENSMDWGVWQAIVHGVAKSRTGLGDFHAHTNSHLGIKTEMSTLPSRTANLTGFLLFYYLSRDL